MDQTRTRRLGKKYLIALLCFVSILSCKKDVENSDDLETGLVKEPEDNYEFGFNLEDYVVKKDTIQSGDTFGRILERNNIPYPKIFEITQKAKDSFDVSRKLQLGKPYTLLCSNDSLQKPKCFIYQPTKERYVVIDFHDSIKAYTSYKPIKYVEKTASGIITSSISQSMSDQDKPFMLALKMSDIYAWTLDFSRLQKNDKFKVVYTEKYIDDSIYAGIHEIKAAYFEHNKEPFYAFEFETDSVLNITDYFSDDAKNLRRAFLKAPVSFSRISSRYNLSRRIAHYGYRLKPHRGTDFAAPNGTPIMATANGTVTRSGYGIGNGKFVKIKHNATYSTQYLHMSKRKAKVGDFVKQGEVIGYVGNTGSSSGNHVCYRFWKNGKEVDPFKQKLPEAKPMSDSLRKEFLEHIKPFKNQLELLEYPKKSIKPDSLKINLPDKKLIT
ncbi:M23 family metallopeptidase [Lacinutrix jangbogonensis]|uniref:M23 family metallopeptidase n=1 Tax=Lacinutrix jangbogonensis TaxID=1469557 RepID=UPI00053E5A94|nr:M23 family metallopeptidase [Lacinutrix jangbogonensis]